MNEGFYPKLSNFGLINLGLLGLFYLNWSLGQNCFDNIRVVVYFIIKVGMVASIKSFMQTLYLEYYLAHKHYSYELMHVHVLECIKILFFKAYIKGFFIKKNEWFLKFWSFWSKKE
jgi:hypothetical protein